MIGDLLSKYIKKNQGMSGIPVEKKMELAKYIREENMGNRLKVRQREKILYGTNDTLPLFSRDKRSSYYAETENPDNPQEGTIEGTFRIRMTAAILLFVGFLLCDAGGYHILGYSTGDIHNMIQKDYFQPGKENDETFVQLSQLLGLDK